MKKLSTRRSMRWLIPSIMAGFVTFSACRKNTEGEQAGTVDGQVLEMENGRPLAGITVEVCAVLPTGDISPIFEPRASATTSADGKFSIRFKGKAGNSFIVKAKDADSIRYGSREQVHAGKHISASLTAVRFIPAHMHLVVKKNEAPQLFVQHLRLRPGPLDTTLPVWGQPNSKVRIHIGAQDLAAGFLRHMAVEIPVIPGSTTPTRVEIEDALQLPRMQ